MSANKAGNQYTPPNLLAADIEEEEEEMNYEREKLLEQGQHKPIVVDVHRSESNAHHRDHTHTPQHQEGDNPGVISSVQEFAKKSPENKCITCCGVTTCILLIIGAIIAIAAAAHFSACANPKFLTVKQKEFSVVEITAFEVTSNGLPGTIKITPSKNSNYSVYASVGSNNNDFRDISFSIDKSDNKVVINAQGPKNLYTSSCYVLNVNISIPPNMININPDFKVLKGSNSHVQFVGTENIRMGQVDLDVTNSAVNTPESVDGKKDRGLTVNSLKVNTQNNVIEMIGIKSYGDIDIKNVNGMIKMTSLTYSGSGKISGSNGAMSLKTVRSGATLTIDNKNGQLDIEGLDVNNGTIGTNAQIANKNGAVDVLVHGSFKGSYDLTATNGNVGISGAGAKEDKKDDHHKTGTLFGGGVSTLKVTNVNGQVDFTAK